MRFTGTAIVVLLLFLVIGAGVVTLFVLLVRALLKYLRAEPVRTRKNEIKKTLGEALKAERGGDDEERLCRAFLLHAAKIELPRSSSRE